MYGAAAFLLTVGLYSRPTLSPSGPTFQSWAIDEAKARIKIIENGGEVEWGTHYGGINKFKFEKEGVGAVPTRSQD